MFLLYTSQNVYSQSITLTPNQNLSTEYGTSQNSFIGRRSIGNSFSSPSAVTNNTLLNSIVGAGYYNSNSNSSRISSGINFVATQTHSTSAAGTRIDFSNTPNNDTGELKRMTIDHNGNVGINESTPLSLVHITETPTSGITPVSGTLLTLENNTDSYLSMMSSSRSSFNLGYSGGQPQGTIHFSFTENLSFSNTINGGEFSSLSINNSGTTFGFVTSNGINSGAELFVNGDYSFSNKVTKNNSQQWNNLDLEGKSVVKCVCTGCTTANDVTISGFAGGVDGKLLYIYADGAPIQLLHYDSASLEANKLILTNSVDAKVSGAIFIYDGTAGYWRMIDYQL